MRFEENDIGEPSHVLAHLMGEVGEIARHVRRLDGYPDVRGAEREAEVKALTLNLNDAFTLLTVLAAHYGIERERAETDVDRCRRDPADARLRRLGLE